MNRPVLNPADVSAAAIMLDTEPFPLVPATWMTLSAFDGSPSALSNSRMASSPGLYAPVMKPLFCTDGKRVNISFTKSSYMITKVVKKWQIS